MYLLKKILVLVSLLLLTSCFDAVDSSSKDYTSSQNDLLSEITPADFAGAVSAKNKITGIEISWAAATKEVLSYKVYRVQGKNLSLLANLPASTTSFIDGNAWWGSIYSYTVRAVDLYGVEEKNTKQVSSISWPGIAAITATSRSSILVHMVSATAVVDEVRVYAQPANGGEKKLLATGTGSDLDIPVTSLRPGFKYKITAQAYVNSLKKEDQNDVEFIVKTNTFGYHADGADGAKWANVVNIRAFGESPGTTPHPLNPDKSPKDRLVEIAFQSFLGMSPQTKYVVIRAIEGNSIDTSATKSCTETDTDSCKVCDLVGQGTLSCIDRFTAPSPARYRYTMALVHEQDSETWVEPIPENDVKNFSVLVPIPPANMVLVQRDAANYEMCQLMNKASDPQNFNRCVYNGTGARPYSTGHNKPALNLPLGFYDFGYNLFVDRYVMACNWTSQAQGGMCGPGGTPGDCIATRVNNATMDPNIGVDGNVLWILANDCAGGTDLACRRSECFIKREGAWSSAAGLQSFTNAAANMAKLATNDPGANGGLRPPMAHASARPTTSNLMCNSFSDPNYGMKRIPRRREHVVMTAWSVIPGEPYYQNYTDTNSITVGVLHDAASGYRCLRSNQNAEVEASSIHQLTSPGNAMAALNLAGQRFGTGDFIGSSLSSDCQSRYGMHYGDYYAPKPISDSYMFETSPVKRFVGLASPLDNGNIDFLIDINGLSSGYIINMSNVATDALDFYTQLRSTGAHTYVNTALGLPVFLTSSPDYLAKLLMPTTVIGGQITYTNHTTGAAGVRQLSSSLRFSMYGHRSWNTGSYNDQTRCVLPAE